MVEVVIEIVIALPIFLLWLTLVAVFVRPFGIQLPLTPFSWAKRRSGFQNLTFSQYLMVGGVLYFGCGMFVINTVFRYFEWKYWHGSSMTSGHVLRDAIGYTVSGVLFGLISWSTRSGNSSK